MWTEIIVIFHHAAGKYVYFRRCGGLILTILAVIDGQRVLVVRINAVKSNVIAHSWRQFPCAFAIGGIDCPRREFLLAVKVLDVIGDVGLCRRERRTQIVCPYSGHEHGED